MTARVVVTGLGIVSCLGNALDEVSAALRAGHSGVSRVDAWRERAMRCSTTSVSEVD